MATAMDVAQFFVDFATAEAEYLDGEYLTNMRLQKMLYFAQGKFLYRYGAPLFDDEIEAWKFGPVVPNVYRAYQKYDKESIHGIADRRTEVTEDELDVLLDVIRDCRPHSTSKLVDMTHEDGSPWKIVYNKTEPHTKIPTVLIKKYFDAHEKPKIKRSIYDNPNITIITPRRDENGNILLSKEEAEWWGEWDDEGEAVGTLVGEC